MCVKGRSITRCESFSPCLLNSELQVGGSRKEEVPIRNGFSLSGCNFFCEVWCSGGLRSFGCLASVYSLPIRVLAHSSSVFDGLNLIVERSECTDAVWGMTSHLYEVGHFISGSCSPGTLVIKGESFLCCYRALSFNHFDTASAKSKINIFFFSGEQE
jgi:hypothetical protein